MSGLFSIAGTAMFAAGVSFDTATNRNPAGFYVWGSALFLAAALLIVGYFIWWPMMVGLDKRRRRQLDALGIVPRAQRDRSPKAPKVVKPPAASPAPAPARQAGTLTILKAEYGAEGVKWKDVSDLVRAEVKANILDFVASNDNLGGDPIEGVPKQMKLTYNLNGGAPRELVVAEGHRAQLPPA